MGREKGIKFDQLFHGFYGVPMIELQALQILSELCINF